jgi:hypothetical protein
MCPPKAPDQPAHKLKDVAPATDGVSQCSKDHEDQANQKDDDSDRPNDRYGGDEPNDEKDYAEDDHGVIATSEVRGRHKPTCRTHTVEGGLDATPLSRASGLVDHQMFATARASRSTATSSSITQATALCQPTVLKLPQVSASGWVALKRIEVGRSLVSRPYRRSRWNPRLPALSRLRIVQTVIRKRRPSRLIRGVGSSPLRQ